MSFRFHARDCNGVCSHRGPHGPSQSPRLLLAVKFAQFSVLAAIVVVLMIGTDNVMAKDKSQVSKPNQEFKIGLAPEFPGHVAILWADPGYTNEGSRITWTPGSIEKDLYVDGTKVKGARTFNGELMISMAKNPSPFPFEGPQSSTESTLSPRTDPPPLQSCDTGWETGGLKAVGINSNGTIRYACMPGQGPGCVYWHECVEG